MQSSIDLLVHAFITIAVGLITAWHMLWLGSITPTIHTPSPTVATSTQPIIPSSASSTAVSQQKVAAANEKTVEKPAIEPKTAVSQAVEHPSVDPVALNTEVRSAVVNILCTLSTDSAVRTTSGSGVFIDSRGIILTNAHVAQYFLLTDYPQSGATHCVIRTGSPAQPAYTAELLYLPAAWVKENASQIKNTEALGTGDNDYALLRVTGAVPGVSLPSRFPALPMDTTIPGIGSSVLISAYAAGFIGANTIESNLFNTSTFASVREFYTFATSSIDVLSVGGSLAAQAGSSGGAVVSAESGDLVGIVSTEDASSTTSGTDLHAITLGYVNRDLVNTGLGGLDGILSSDAAKSGATFNAGVAPVLRQLLISALEH